mgnify:CR=1 FL=1
MGKYTPGSGNSWAAFPTELRPTIPFNEVMEYIGGFSGADQAKILEKYDPDGRGGLILKTAISVVPRSLKTTPPLTKTNGGAAPSSRGVSNVLKQLGGMTKEDVTGIRGALKGLQSPLAQADVDAYSNILSNMPGMSTEVYDKMLKQAEDSARLNMGLAMMQAGFGAAAAAPKRGESPFSTLSRTLFQPLSAAAMQTMGAARKEKMAAQLGKLGAQRGISTAAFQAAMGEKKATDAMVGNILLAAAKTKPETLNISSVDGATAVAEVVVNGKRERVAIPKSNVKIYSSKVPDGGSRMMTVGESQGTTSDGTTVKVPPNTSLISYDKIGKEGKDNTQHLPGQWLTGKVKYKGKDYDFNAHGNLVIRTPAKGDSSLYTSGVTTATITVNGEEIDVPLPHGHPVEGYEKIEDTKDPYKWYFLPEGTSITAQFPNPKGSGYIWKTIEPGVSNAVSMNSAEAQLFRLKNGPDVFNRLRLAPAAGARDVDKTRFINTSNKTVRLPDIGDVGPGEFKWLTNVQANELPDDLRNIVVASPESKPKQSDIWARVSGQNEQFGKPVRLILQETAHPNPNKPNIRRFFTPGGNPVSAPNVQEILDTHTPWTLTETIKIADAGKVKAQIKEDVSVGEDIQVFSSNPKQMGVGDTLTEYRYKGRKIDLGDLIGTDALKGVLTTTEEIDADLREAKPTHGSPVSTDDLRFDPAQLALIENVLGLETGTAQGADVVEVKIRHRAPGAPETVKSIAEYFFRGKKLNNEGVKKLIDAGALQGVMTIDEEITSGIREEKPTHGPPVSLKDLKINPEKISVIEYGLDLTKGSVKGGDVVEVKTRHSLKPGGVSITEYWYKGKKLDNAAVNKLLTTDALRGELTVDQQIGAGIKAKPRAQKPVLMVNQSTETILGIKPRGTGMVTPDDIDSLNPTQKTQIVSFADIGQPMNFTVTPGEAITFGGATYNAGQEVKISGLKYATLSPKEQKIFDSRLVSGTEAGWRAGRTGDWNNAFKQYQKDTKASAPYKDLTANQISTLFGRFPGKRIIPRSDLNTQFQLFLTPETERFDTAEKAYANFRKTGYVDDIPWNKLAYIDQRAYSMIPRSVYRKDPEQIYKAYETRLKKLNETRDKFSVPSTEDQANFSQTARMYTLLGRAKELLPETGIFEGTLSKIFANLADWVPGNDQEVELKSIFQEINSSLATFADPDTKKRMTNWRLQLVQTDMPKFTSSELLNRKSVNKAMQVLEDNLQNQFSITQQQKNYIGPGFAATLVAHGIKPDTPVDTTKYTWADPSLVGRPFSTKVKTLMALGGKLFTQESFDKLSPGALVLTKVKDKPDVMFLKFDTKTMDRDLHPKCTEDRCVIQTRDGNSPAPGAEAINFNMK